MTTLIELQDISKVYLTETVETHALSGISADINKGEFVLVTGPSGCGKSTLLAILGLLEKQTGGSYKLSGKETRNFSFNEGAKLRGHEIGFVFQSFNLIDDLSIQENVALPLRFLKRTSSRERLEKSLSVLNDLDIAHRAEHYPTQISGGQQQRVAIARALVTNPTIILADEPTGNLDPESSAKVLEVFEQLRENGTTLCVASHDVGYFDLADRIIRLDDGMLMSE